MTFSVDALIEQIAADQRGLVTRAQLLTRGITSHAIANRVRANRLQLLHRGVYRVGPVVAPHAREFAAVLACGGHAVLSHTSAAALWKLLDPDDTARVEITVRQGDRRRRPTVRVHRACLQPEDVTTRENIPVTTPARTILDLAPALSSRDLEHLVARAERLNLLKRRDLQSITTKHARRPGALLLRMLLEDEAEPALTRSKAEERFLALIRKAQLPAPKTNAQVGEYELDFFWRREQVVVEIDGYKFHATRQMFEKDRRRDAWLAANGMRVMRFTWRQLIREPEVILVRLVQTLARADR